MIFMHFYWFFLLGSTFRLNLHIPVRLPQPIPTMTDYFDEHAPDADPMEQELQNLRRLRVLAALNGLEVDLDAPSASKAAIEKLPVHVITKDEQVECPICKMEGEEGESYKVLPCKHEFHDACVKIWLSKVSMQLCVWNPSIFSF